MTEPLMETNLPEWELLHRGKVRDTYGLGGEHMLMVATDRISAFDVVLPTGIPGKGEVLNRMSAFWFKRTEHIVPNHFVTLAKSSGFRSMNIWGYEAVENMPREIAQRAMIVRKAERIDIECIVRGYITGSAWGEYRREGAVCGLPVPEGMLESQKFPEPRFTPTTKAEEGHDENMTWDQVVDMVGEEMALELSEKSIAVYLSAAEYAQKRGIILADTKMEFGIVDHELTLIDELLTPDSSRFWPVAGYQPGRSQPSYDKQYVRDWLDSQGWDHEPPAPELPPDVVAQTSERYLEAYYLLTGERLVA